VASLVEGHAFAVVGLRLNMFGAEVLRAVGAPEDLAFLKAKIAFHLSHQVLLKTSLFLAYKLFTLYSLLLR
jgi:hypothetical protein